MKQNITVQWNKPYHKSVARNHKYKTLGTVEIPAKRTDMMLSATWAKQEKNIRLQTWEPESFRSYKELDDQRPVNPLRSSTSVLFAHDMFAPNSTGWERPSKWVFPSPWVRENIGTPAKKQDFFRCLCRKQTAASQPLWASKWKV